MMINKKQIRITCVKQNVFMQSTAEQLKKRNLEKTFIVDTFKSVLDCDELESVAIYYNHVNEISQLDRVKWNVQYLMEISVSREVIKKYGFVLTMPLGMLAHVMYLLPELIKC